MVGSEQSPFLKSPITIILIIGLPGSGKTTLALNKSKVTGGIVIDDIRTRKDIDDAINNGYNHIYITDPHLCRSKVLENAKKYIDSLKQSHVLECIFFKNNPDQCMKNVELRNDGRDVKETIKRYTQIYNPPADAVEVYKEATNI